MTTWERLSTTPFAVDAAMGIVGHHRYRLLEALAEAIAAGVLEIPGVEAVTVSVRKLRPPVAADMASAGVACDASASVVADDPWRLLGALARTWAIVRAIWRWRSGAS